MKTRTIFGIAGQLGSGKDTICNILRELNLVPENNVIGFAKGVKECAKEYFDIPITERTTRSRLAWQGIGDLFREIHYNIYGNKDIWVNYLFKKMKDDESYAISDVRYENEMKKILSYGGIIVFIDTTPQTRRKRVENRRGVPIVEEEWVKMNSHHSEKDVEPSFFKKNILPNLSPQENVIIIDNNLDHLDELRRLVRERFIEDL